MRFVLVGNYGVGNLGDEALRDFFVEMYPDHQWVVVSATPEEGEVPRLPLGLRSLFSSWGSTIGAIRRSDGVVFGGGSLFTDAESVFACFLWGLYAFVAWVFQKRVLLAFQGIGPFHTTIGAWIAAWVCRRASYISVRDTFSSERLQKWGIDAVQTFDPVLGLFEDQEQEEEGDILVAIPRKNSDEEFQSVLLSLTEEEQFDAVHILSMQPDNADESSFILDLVSSISLPCTIIPVGGLAQLGFEVSQAKLVLTERYHGAIAAIAYGKPAEIISQKEGDKLSSLGAIAPEEMGDLVEKGYRSLSQALSS